VEAAGHRRTSLDPSVIVLTPPFAVGHAVAYAPAEEHANGKQEDEGGHQFTFL
jgi:hypothetical protein